MTAAVTEVQDRRSLYYRACLEGTVAKDADSTYRQGQRVRLKVKR